MDSLPFRSISRSGFGCCFISFAIKKIFNVIKMSIEEMPQTRVTIDAVFHRLIALFRFVAFARSYLPKSISQIVSLCFLNVIT